MIGLEQCWLHFSWCYQGEPNVCKLILGHTTLSFGSILWLCSLRICQWVLWCIPSYIGAFTFSYYLFFSCIAKSTEPSKQIFSIWRNEIELCCDAQFCFLFLFLQFHQCFLFIWRVILWFLHSCDVHLWHSKWLMQCTLYSLHWWTQTGFQGLDIWHR